MFTEYPVSLIFTIGAKRPAVNKLEAFIALRALY